MAHVRISPTATSHAVRADRAGQITHELAKIAQSRGGPISRMTVQSPNRFGIAPPPTLRPNVSGGWVPAVPAAVQSDPDSPNEIA
jgi:hypothetical protein